MPKIEDSEIEVDLLCGILDESDSILKSCSIKAMTGGLRKKIAQPDIRRKGFKIINSVLDGCVESIGGKPFIPSRELKRMLMADADYLLMKIRQHSIGDEIVVELECPSCNYNYKAEVNISEIECYSIDDEITEIKDGIRVFKVETGNWDCVFRYPNREDQKIIAKFAQDNPIQAQYQLYARTMLENDGEPVKDGGEIMRLFDSLPVKIIDELADALQNALPGVENFHYSICPRCGQRIEMEVSGADFLFGKPKERTKKKSLIG